MNSNKKKQYALLVNFYHKYFFLFVLYLGTPIGLFSGDVYTDAEAETLFGPDTEQYAKSFFNMQYPYPAIEITEERLIIHPFEKAGKVNDARREGEGEVTQEICVFFCFFLFSQLCYKRRFLKRFVF